MQQHEQRRDYDQWHLDKRVNVSHILTTIALVGAMTSVWVNTNDRITRLEVQQEQAQRTAIEIKNELRELNGKLDKLIDRMMANGGYGR